MVPTGAANGLCRPVSAGSNPDNECADDGAASCRHDGSCDGKGGCLLYAATTPCGAGPSCTNNVEMSASACKGSTRNCWRVSSKANIRKPLPWFWRT